MYILYTVPRYGDITLQKGFRNDLVSGVNLLDLQEDCAKHNDCISRMMIGTIFDYKRALVNFV